MEWGKLSTNLPWADAFEGGGGGGEMPCLFITEKKGESTIALTKNSSKTGIKQNK